MRGEGLAPNALLVRLPERLRSNQKGREVSATGSPCWRACVDDSRRHPAAAVAASMVWVT